MKDLSKYLDKLAGKYEDRFRCELSKKIVQKMISPEKKPFRRPPRGKKRKFRREKEKPPEEKPLKRPWRKERVVTPEEERFLAPSHAAEDFRDVLESESVLEAAVCEKDLRRFLACAWKVIEPETVFVPNWHIDAICDHLMAVTRREIKRLIINVPPRHCKSLTVSVFWQAWEWLTVPAERNVYASYASTLSERDNVRFSRLINSVWYKERWLERFRLLTDTQMKIENDKGGHRIATSVGGVATGEGGSKIIVDDPHNVKDVTSEAKRISALLWWDEVMASRLDDPKTGAKVIIMQRSHEDDLTGHVLERETEYVHLCLPARFDGHHSKTVLHFQDPRKKEGEPLWEEKMGIRELNNLEEELGEYAFAAQYQQSPVPRGGGMFKIRHLQENFMDAYMPENIHHAIRFWDKAGTKDGGAFTCGALLLKTKDKRYIIADIARGQWDAPKREAKILQTTKEDAARFKQEKIKYTIWTEQEPGSGGLESAQATIKMLAGYVVYAEKPTGRKEVRAEPFACQVNAGNVSILDRMWTKECLEKLEFYPVTKYKDWGDALGGAFNKLNNPKRAGAWGKK